MSLAFPLTNSNPNLESSGGMSLLADNLKKVRQRVSAAEKRAGRAAQSVDLIAVSKTKSPDMVGEAATLGVMSFGENYVQEALRKIEKCKSLQQSLHFKWHLIGSLQTNKCKLAVGMFDTIQSVDRVELAQALNNRALEAGLVQKIFVQIKLGDEPSKNGVSPREAPALIEKLREFKNLNLQGLMSLPPIEAEPEASRKYFIQLRNLRDTLQKNLLLSMGTTHDFEIAIEEGADMVRVGTAIFGSREGVGG